MEKKIYEVRLKICKGKGKGFGKGKIYKDVIINFEKKTVVFYRFEESEETWKIHSTTVLAK